MENAKGGIQTSRLTSLDTNSGREWLEALEIGNYFVASLPQSAHPRWRKFERFQGRKVGAARFLEKFVRTHSFFFEHWRIGMIGAFA
jgi:hypothetical protein